MTVDIITGKNSVIGISTPLKALIEFYTGFNERNVDNCMQNWASCDDIIMCNPIGGIRIGREAILHGYQRIMQGDTKVYVEFYDYRLIECADAFYAVGRERGFAEHKDVRIELSIRTSRVFRKLNDVWRQVHHHGSIDDPSLLNQYKTFTNRR